MAATLLDVLMIVSLGILAGTGAGLLIGFLAGKQTRDLASMTAQDKQTNLLLVLACSSTVIALLAWYLFPYSAV
jgi:NhaP-type Na+/H+ or K+/H+ antiporter